MHAISILSTFDAQRHVDAAVYRFIIFFFERIDEQFYYFIVDATYRPTRDISKTFSLKRGIVHQK